MKPIAIFRHAPIEGPGYFATYLERHGMPWRLVKVDEGEAVPADPREFLGLVFMGGPMSVNSDLPWLDPAMRLIRKARDSDVPMLGHCLGAQLMAKALGGTVTRNAVKEIGWGRVDAVEDGLARDWFGASSFNSFHWHGETFSIPPGATRIAASAHCDNQAFVLGKHLSLQCHVEMTPELIAAWCRSGAREIERNLKKSPAVQPVEEIQRDLEARLAALHRVADRIYDRWTACLKTGE
ncbi:MAG: type 1 glutamine amidotransferase [Betaproteobacteria bacterium]|nr:type 1 glutamine amidotransferase [Betaproteobacteria bacterium]MDH3436573.1 type 1 glutamine amidotransferase [Betaproteobacteria bacterium]